MDIEKEIQKLIENAGARKNEPNKDGLAYTRHRNPLLVSLDPDDGNKNLCELVEAWQGETTKPTVLPLQQISMAPIPSGDSVLQSILVTPFAKMLGSQEPPMSASAEKALKLYEKMFRALLLKHSFYKKNLALNMIGLPTDQAAVIEEVVKRDLVSAADAASIIDEFVSAMQALVLEMYGVENAVFLITVNDILFSADITVIKNAAFAIGHPSLYVLCVTTSETWMEFARYKKPDELLGIHVFQSESEVGS